MAPRRKKQPARIEPLRADEREDLAASAAAVYVPIDRLVPWADNPRVNDHAVEAVAKSIARFGFADPIVARLADDMVIAGHTRLKAARSLGLEVVPVRFLDVTRPEAEALALASNKLGELADWDDDAVRTILRNLAAEDAALPLGLGWGDEEIAALIASTTVREHERNGPAPDDPKDDELPKDVPPTSELGAIYEAGRHRIACGDCLEVLRSLDAESVDAIVCDPPYGIGFMGKDWDVSVPGIDFAREALRVLKPGGHLIAFAATRTQHRLAVALEDGGFEIRDVIAWLQWQGFPKNHDVSRAIDDGAGASRPVVGTKLSGIAVPGEGQRHTVGGSRAVEVPITAPATAEAKRWSGWGTALKPAQEPAVLARKPLQGTVAANVLAHGVGAINIDGCRYAVGDPAWPGPQEEAPLSWETPRGGIWRTDSTAIAPATTTPGGRWPANLYYCPKPATSEKEAGLEEAGLEEAGLEEAGSGVGALRDEGRGKTARNTHATVKPVRLMRWLVRLVTPPGGLVVDPFLGSGTTLVAVEREGFRGLGIERDPRYVDIALARVHAAIERTEDER